MAAIALASYSATLGLPLIIYADHHLRVAKIPNIHLTTVIDYLISGRKSIVFDLWDK